MLRTAPRPARVPFVSRFYQAAVGSALVAAAACGGKDATGPNNGVTGQYPLRTVNGRSLPAVVFQSGANRIDVTAGNLSLNSDQTFSISLTLAVVSGGRTSSETSTDNGTYTQTGSSLTFRYSDGSTSTGSVNGGTVTFIERDPEIGDLAFVFTR